MMEQCIALGRCPISEIPVESHETLKHFAVAIVRIPMKFCVCADHDGAVVSRFCKHERYGR